MKEKSSRCKQQGMVLRMKVGRGVLMGLTASVRLGFGKFGWAGLLEPEDQDTSEDIWIKPKQKNPQKTGRKKL